MMGDRGETVYSGAIGKDEFGEELKSQVQKVHVLNFNKFLNYLH